MTNLTEKLAFDNSEEEKRHGFIMGKLNSIEQKLDKLTGMDTTLTSIDLGIAGMATNISRLANTIARNEGDDFPEASLFQLVANIYTISAIVREAIRPSGQQPPTLQPRGIEWHLSRMADFLAVGQGDNTSYGTLPQQNRELYLLMAKMLGEYDYNNYQFDTGIGLSHWGLLKLMYDYIGGQLTGPNLQQALSNLSLNTAIIGQNTNGLLGAIEANTQATVDCCEGGGETNLCDNPTSTKPSDNSVFGDLVATNNTQVVNNAHILDWAGVGVNCQSSCSWIGNGDEVLEIPGQSDTLAFVEFDPATPTAVLNTSAFAISVIFIPGDGTSVALLVQPGACFQINETTPGFFAVYAGGANPNAEFITASILQ